MVISHQMGRQTTFNYISPKRTSAGNAANDGAQPRPAGKFRARALGVWRSPLALVFFVWAVLFLLAGLCYAYIE
jgi:hypothetical protein